MAGSGSLVVGTSMASMAMVMASHIVHLVSSSRVSSFFWLSKNDSNSWWTTVAYPTNPCNWYCRSSTGDNTMIKAYQGCPLCLPAAHKLHPHTAILDWYEAATASPWHDPKHQYHRLDHFCDTSESLDNFVVSKRNDQVVVFVTSVGFAFEVLARHVFLFYMPQKIQNE